MNEETGVAALPMDQYWYSDQENDLINTAVAFLIEDCVVESGHTMISWGGEYQLIQDLKYGQWSRSLAARFGAAPAFRTIPGVVAKVERQTTDADWSAYEQCTTEVGRANFPELRPNLNGDTSTQANIEMEANFYTSHDPEYLDYRAAWEACIADKGMSLEEEDSWSVTSSNSKEAEIRNALLSVDCMDSSGGAQTPYDINAQYQAVLMKDEQANLNALAEEKSSALDRARQILRDHGVADASL